MRIGRYTTQEETESVKGWLIFQLVSSKTLSRSTSSFSSLQSRSPGTNATAGWLVSGIKVTALKWPAAWGQGEKLSSDGSRKQQQQKGWGGSAGKSTGGANKTSHQWLRISDNQSEDLWGTSQGMRNIMRKFSVLEVKLFSPYNDQKNGEFSWKGQHYVFSSHIVTFSSTIK